MSEKVEERLTRIRQHHLTFQGDPAYPQSDSWFLLQQLAEAREHQRLLEIQLRCARDERRRAAEAVLIARGRLREALRRHCIVQRHRLADGGGAVHVGYHCRQCDAKWKRDAPEAHRAECRADLAEDGHE